MKKLFFTTALIVLSASLLAAPKIGRATLYTIGDSTMAEKDTTKGNPERGWGMAFRSLVDDQKMEVINLAKNGRSSKSFRNEGIWNKAFLNLKEGDFVFIQFGHNDAKKDSARYTNPETEFKANLVCYIRDVKSKGATPILFTSIARRRFDKEDRIVDSHGKYVTIIPEIARQEEILMIDLFSLSKSLFESKGKEGSKIFFKYLAPNTNPNYPEGFKDDTHLNEQGAIAIAEIVAEELKKSNSKLKNYLK